MYLHKNNPGRSYFVNDKTLRVKIALAVGSTSLRTLSAKLRAVMCQSWRQQTKLQAQRHRQCLAEHASWSLRRLVWIRARELAQDLVLAEAQLWMSKVKTRGGACTALINLCYGLHLRS